MNYFYKIVGITVLLILLSTKATYAGNFAGGELTYSCIGTSTYKLTYTYYRDCSAISPPTQLHIQIICSSNNSFSFNAMLNKLPYSTQEITHICPYDSTHCNNGTLLGIEETVYEGTYTLSQCSSWRFSFGSCCIRTEGNMYLIVYFYICFACYLLAIL